MEGRDGRHSSQIIHGEITSALRGYVCRLAGLRCLKDSGVAGDIEPQLR